MLENNIKKFSKSLCDRYDPIARQIAKKYFADRYGYVLVDNEDKFGIDLWITNSKNDIIGGLEVEVREKWKTKKFPFSELNVPLRKSKYFKMDLPTFFMSINMPGNSAFLVTGKKILSCRVEQNNNRYLQEGEKEYFYKVPVYEEGILQIYF